MLRVVAPTPDADARSFREAAGQIEGAEQVHVARGRGARGLGRD